MRLGSCYAVLGDFNRFCSDTEELENSKCRRLKMISCISRKFFLPRSSGEDVMIWTDFVDYLFLNHAG